MKESMKNTIEFVKENIKTRKKSNGFGEDELDIIREFAINLLTRIEDRDMMVPEEESENETIYPETIICELDLMNNYVFFLNGDMSKKKFIDYLENTYKTVWMGSREGINEIYGKLDMEKINKMYEKNEEKVYEKISKELDKKWNL